MMFNTSHINIAIYQSIVYAGAAGNVFLPGTPVKKIKPDTNPFTINLLDGDHINSTHICQLDILWLQEKSKESHIVPRLVHASLVSIKVLCGAGCNVEYDTNECRVIYKDKKIWNGNIEPSKGLWVLPLNPTLEFKLSMNHMQYIPTKEVASNAHTIKSKRSLINYLHQCLFWPPKKTLLKSIANNQFTTWPGLTYVAAQKYIPETAPATDKCHMKRKQQGIRYSKEKVKTELYLIE